MPVPFTGKRFSSLRNLYIPLTVVLLLLVPFGIYEVYYVEGRQTYLRDRSFRLLGEIGRQVDALVNIESDKLRAAGSRFDSDNGINDTIRKTWALEVFKDGIFGQPWDPRKQTLKQEYKRDGFVGLQVAPVNASFSVTLAYSEAPKGAPLVSETRFVDAILRRSIEGLTQDFFDDVLIADDSGKVLFQLRDLGLHVYELEPVIRRGATADKTTAGTGSASAKKGGDQSAKTADASASFSLATKATSEMPVTIAGTSYRLLVQPVRAAVKYQGAEREGDGALNFLVCGLWREDRWHTQAFELPYTTVIWAVLVLLTVFFFAWPFVKVRHMSAKERFRPRDAWYMMLSALVATVLLTLILANSYYLSFVESTTRAELQGIAKDIKHHFDTEMRLYMKEFEDVVKHPEFLERAQDLNKWRPARLPIACSLQSGHLHDFDQIMYVDSQGRQRLKLLVKGAITPQTDVSQYQWFRALQNGSDPLILPPPVDELPELIAAAPQTRKRFTAGNGDPPPDPGDKYRIFMMRSPNTGEFQMLFIRTLGWIKEKPDLPDIVKTFDSKSALVLVTRPPALVDPVLPPGFGFAVIDQAGVVQLHSDSIRNLEENFFEECRRNPYLVASAFAGKSEFQKINYLGEDKSAYVTPLTGLSENALTLVVFHSSNLGDVAHLAIMLFCGVLLGLPLLVLVCVALIDLARGRRTPPAFLWPNPQHTATYLYLCLTNFLCAGFLAEFLLLRPQRATGRLLVEAACLVGATVILSVLYFNMSRLIGSADSKIKVLGLKPAHLPRLLVITAAAFLIVDPFLLGGFETSLTRKGPIWPEAVPAAFAVLALIAAFFVHRVRTKFFHAAYTAAAVSVLLGIIGAPCVALFYASWETVDGLKQRYSQIVLRKALLEQEHTLEEAYEANTPADADRLIDWRLKQSRYLDSFFTSQPLGQNDTTSKKAAIGTSALEQFLVNSAPTYVPARRLGAQFLEADLGRMDLTDWIEMGGEPALVAGRKAWISNQPFSWPPPWWLLLVHLGVLAALSYWIYHLVEKLFLTNSHPAPALPSVGWKSADDITVPHIVIGHSRSRKTTKLRGIPGLQSIDLRVALKPEAEIPVFPAWTKVVAIDHFEFNVDDPDYNLRRLELIEKLLYVHKYTLIIISTLDPLYYLQESRETALTSKTDEAGATLESGKLLDRWSRALSKFKKVELRDDSEIEFDRVLRVATRLDPRLNDPRVEQEYVEGLKAVMIVHGEESEPQGKRLQGFLAQYGASQEIQNRRTGKYSPDFRNVNRVALTGCEAALASHESTQKLLELVEELADNSGHCVLFTSVDLWAYVADEQNIKKMGAELQQRWSRALKRFEIRDVASKEQVKLAQRIKEECSRTAYLRRVGAELFDELIGERDQKRAQDAEYPDGDHLAEILRDRLDSYYRVLWSSLTENERLVLYQLSTDGWANPLNQAAIQQLQRKEFVTDETPYRIMNESFRRFVRHVASSFEIQMWQKQEQESSWRSVRLALTTMFLVLAAWLLYAQKDLFQLSIGYIVTLGGAVTAVLNLLGSFKSKALEPKK
jgi:hypothetical protein